MPRPAPSEKEDPITGRFFEHLMANDAALPFHIQPETPVCAPDGRAPGRNDFRFYDRREHSHHLFLTVEAKRMRIPKSRGRLCHNTAAYCGNEGMGRFVSGKYSASPPEGAMLACVMAIPPQP